MKQEDLNEVMWNSLPDWQKYQLADGNESASKRLVADVIKQIIKNLNHVPSHIEGKFEDGEEWIRLQDAIDAVEAESE